MFIVTHFGSDSSGDLWTPKSRFFSDYDEAFQHFLSLAPDLTDEDNEAEQITNPKFPKYDHPSYVVLEVRVQKGGYLMGSPNCSKRPFGVLIARIQLE